MATLAPLLLVAAILPAAEVEIAGWYFRETRSAGPQLALLEPRDLRARVSPGWEAWIEFGGTSVTGEALGSSPTLDQGIGGYTGSNLAQGRPDGMSLVIQAAAGASPEQNDLILNNGREVFLHVRAPEGQALNLSRLSLNLRSTATGFRKVKFHYLSDVDQEKLLEEIDPYHQTPDGRIAWTEYDFALPPLSPQATQATVRIEFHGARSGSGNTRLDQISFRRTAGAESHSAPTLFGE